MMCSRPYVRRVLRVKQIDMEAAAGNDPASAGSKPAILPLNYAAVDTRAGIEPA